MKKAWLVTIWINILICIGLLLWLSIDYTIKCSAKDKGRLFQDTIYLKPGERYTICFKGDTISWSFINGGYIRRREIYIPHEYK